MGYKDETKKWKLTYPNSDVFYLSQKEYDHFFPRVQIAQNSNAEALIQMPDKRIVLSSRIQSIVENPQWRDPVEFKRKEIFYMFRRDYLERRTNGDPITWKEYVAKRRPEAKKMMREFLETLKDD